MSRRLLSLLCLLTVTLLGLAGPRTHAAEPPDIDSTVTMFYYKDLGTVAPFYEKTLGLSKTLDLGWCKLYRVTPTSYVGLIDERRGFHKVARNKPAMLSIVTKNVDGWHARMTAAGVRIVKPLKPLTDLPASGMAPVRGFVVRDPGGYTVEFFAWRDDARSREVRGLAPADP